jgi:transcriptional regulator with XRE-family HTH domain
MIKNERQYRISKAEADKFERTLLGLEADHARPSHVHPRLIEAERAGLRSQLEDLRQEIEQYEALREGRVPAIKVVSLEELPNGLIKARIAKGMSQRDLAHAIGVKEQQIQRYEAEGYRSASFDRVCEIARAMNVRLGDDVHLVYGDATSKALLKRVLQSLTTVGLPRDFVLGRLVRPQLASELEEAKSDECAALVLGNLMPVLRRVFGWEAGEVLSDAPLSIPNIAAASARFRVPARRDGRKVTAYAAYAHHLAMVTVEACDLLPCQSVTATAGEMREAMLGRYGELSLESATRYCWDIGIPVLPLRDSGAFHGALWRFKARNVIVLKQISRHQSRWLSDILHELRHAAERPDQAELEVMEAEPTSKERRESAEEHEASKYAAAIALDGRAEELAQACVDDASGEVRYLKSAVKRVAGRENVSVGLLANYMAYRLSLQQINWWGTAENLGEAGPDAWTTVRDVFLERMPLERVAEIDRELLTQALM